MSDGLFSEKPYDAGDPLARALRALEATVACECPVLLSCPCEQDCPPWKLQ